MVGKSKTPKGPRDSERPDEEHMRVTHASGEWQQWGSDEGRRELTRGSSFKVTCESSQLFQEYMKRSLSFKEKLRPATAGLSVGELWKSLTILWRPEKMSWKFPNRASAGNTQVSTATSKWSSSRIRMKSLTWENKHVSLGHWWK